MSNTLSLQSVSKVYQSAGAPPTEALKTVNLEVPKGDFLAIMGPSGSGKSSLMNIIGLLDRHFEGTYEIDGENVSRLSANKQADFRSQKIGFVFQQFNLLKRTSVLQNVLLPTIYNPGKDDIKRAQKVIEQVGLSGRAEYKTNQLSGGQMQRVAIARALIMQPSLLLADEPTGNLDTKTAHEIMDLFTEINKQGTTVVLITHEDDIAAYAKRIIRLRDGAIEKEEVK